MPSLVQPLPDGPIDIVGDVHGEIEALRRLLVHLGYDDDGGHDLGRHLVFVGDLVNRGPDSPAVFDWVQNLVQAKRAQCLLGNHELHLLLGYRKASNNWFYGKPHMDEAGREIPQTSADDSTRRRMRDWFRSLPLALERTDLRIVHACWDAELVQLARSGTDLLQLYQRVRSDIDSQFTAGDDLVRQTLEHQNRNPVLKLTSGPQQQLEAPVSELSGVRGTRQVAWWKQYHDAEFCVFGHYSHPVGTFLGSHASCCVDFGVGKRWTERRMGVTDSFAWKLAALRYPEKELVFDDGDRRPCGSSADER